MLCVPVCQEEGECKSVAEVKALHLSVVCNVFDGEIFHLEQALHAETISKPFEADAVAVIKYFV